MNNNINLVKLKYGIWAIAFFWVVFDLVWLYTREPFNSETFFLHCFLAACIPLVWWVVSFFTRCLYGEFMFKRGPKFVSFYRSIMIFLCAAGVVICIVLKVIYSLSGDELEEPFPAAAFVIPAALLYFSLLSRSTH